MEEVLTVHIPNEVRRTLNRTSGEMGRDIRLYAVPAREALFRSGVADGGDSPRDVS